MDTCDRHLGAIAMRVSCFLICLSTVLCVRASGLAHSRSPPRLHCAPSTCEGPPHLNNRPADYARCHQSGNSQGVHHHSLVQRFHATSGFGAVRVDRTGGTRRPDRVDFQTPVKPDSTLGSCFVIVLGINQCRVGFWGIFASQLTIVGIYCL